MDKEGNIWYTGNSAALIGKLDPKTGEVTEYKMPDPAARDPHTPLFDKKGSLWFTLQGANMVGRLDPETGEIKLVTTPTPRSQPYGMVISSHGVPFIVRVRREQDREASIPTRWRSPSTRCRTRTRVRAASRSPSDDVMWYADYSRGYLGRFDPKTGTAKEWPSPSGPKSQPYGIASVERHHLVQRVGRPAEHARPLRSEDREVPDLDHPVRRRRRPQHECDAERRHRDG